MRINRVELIWFRGAAESGILDAGAKIIVVYGANASGKSTFVDGLEYITRNGRICHLQHEYSGSYQEKGVRNTSAPSKENSRSAILLDGGSSIVADITRARAYNASSVAKFTRQTV
jgi:AAA15 family ATPase/GTPase